MKFIIFCDDKNYLDQLEVEGDTIEEIREKAKKETSKRGWNEECCWSEKVED